MVTKTPEIRALERETDAARVLRDHLAEISGDDAELIRDMIEGETSIRELIDAAVEQIGRDRAAVMGIDAFMEQQANRKHRLERRQEAFRVAVRVAMEVAELSKHDLPIATVSRKPLGPKLVTTDEAAIPSAFWKPQPPKLDRKAVTDALKDKQQVPGAELSNGGETLQIRWS